jgi:TolA-binding protein
MAEELSPRAADAAELARQHLGHMSARQREAVLNAVRSKIGDRRRTRALRRASLMTAAAVSCAAIAALLVVRHHGHAEPLSFRVEGAELHAGGFVEAGPSNRPVLRFSDGSEVALAETSRVHIRSVDEHGAQVTLDEGHAHAYITHAVATHWSFEAGPFVVRVTGTAFGISWVADEGRLDVRLENGAVTVSGPVFDNPVALRAGQWLTVRARDVLIRDLGSADDAKKEPTEPGRDLEPEATAAFEPAAADTATPKRAKRHAAPAAASSLDHHWSAELADGKFGAIVDEAVRMGLDAAFSTTSGDDLAALADAARYTRRYEIAHGAFLSERRRFPSSERAHVAAFSLGRLSDAQQEVRVALSWFETYLIEAPDGVYASEALGRKMLLVQQLDGNDAARPLAEAYVHRFPSGTYARPAHALTLGP